jgi:hypothetical protein
MHILRHIPVDRSAGPSIGEGTGSPERPRNDVQERDSEEEIHDHATREAEQNEVEESEERTEDDNTMAAVEIRRSGDESKDSEDDDTSEEEEDTSEEDDNGDGKEPSGITLHSESTHKTGGASIDASDGSYRPGRPSGPRHDLGGTGDDHGGAGAGVGRYSGWRGSGVWQPNPRDEHGASFWSRRRRATELTGEQYGPLITASS